MSTIFDVRLHSLMKVVESGSYTKAARELSLTQPAVSQHIHSLESELNVKIFEYSNNRLYITHEGETVVKYATRILALESNLRRKLDDEKLQLTFLTIGITHTSESNAIIEALAKYADLRKNVKMKIVTDTTENLCKMLKNYEIDIAVSEGAISDPAFQSVNLDSDSIVVAVSPNHPFSRRKTVTIDELKGERLILRLPGSSTRTLFASALASRNLSLDDFDVGLEIDNVSAIKALLRQDMGVSVLAKSACQDEAAKKKIYLLPIEDFKMVREINLVYLKDFEYREITDDIVQCYNAITQPDAGAQ